jgi:membrane-bound inhibitor of C-type lysozyme
MNRRQRSIFGAILFLATAVSSAAAAQSFQSYRCSDGSQFIVAFCEYDKRAHLQIGGKSVTLAKRFGLSGARYSGDGVALKLTTAGTTVKYRKRPITACELS